MIDLCEYGNKTSGSVRCGKFLKIKLAVSFGKGFCCMESFRWLVSYLVS